MADGHSCRITDLAHRRIPGPEYEPSAIVRRLAPMAKRGTAESWMPYIPTCFHAPLRDVRNEPGRIRVMGDGTPVATDGSFPFELQWSMPPDAGQVMISVRAVDMGNNESESEVIQITSP